MGFNQTLNSSDFGIDVSLVSSGSDATVPKIVAVDPPPGEVPLLNQITVTFSEPVRGVTPDDLVINQDGCDGGDGLGHDLDLYL